MSTLTLTEWLKSLAKLERACRRTLKERGVTADDDGVGFPPAARLDGVNGHDSDAGNGTRLGGDDLALAWMRGPHGAFASAELNEDDGETAALRHFIAAGAFVLAMMAAVVFVLAAYRVPNLWSQEQTSTMSSTSGDVSDYRNGDGQTVIVDRSGRVLLQASRFDSVAGRSA